MNYNETLYSMALTCTPHLGLVHQHRLIDELGSATNVFAHRNEIKDVLPEASRSLQEALAGLETCLPRCEQELEWAQSHSVQCISFLDEAYPQRLRGCPDAPLVLYYCGKADLNAVHAISIVGTRQITEYGKDLCRTFVADLARLCPDCLVLSGLAYGVDIHAHRACLENHLPTIGVLAHGLEQIYPRLHRDTATQMIQQGGLLTEYMSGTRIDKVNFRARNRIVAGIAEATVVIESAERGGSLITARIANDYNREVFAFPGRVGDECSAGCNQLIRNQKAHLLTTAQELVAALGWPTAEERKTQREQGIQRELFVNLPDEEQRIADALLDSDGKAVSQLSLDTGISIGQLSSLLFSMEMKGVVKQMAGNQYRLLK